jgi:hypothetical protein
MERNAVLQCVLAGMNLPGPSAQPKRRSPKGKATNLRLIWPKSRMAHSTAIRLCKSTIAVPARCPPPRVWVRSQLEPLSAARSSFFF